MFKKLTRLFSRKHMETEMPASRDETSEELKAVRKLLRKQGVLLEMIHADFLEDREKDILQQMAPVLAIADAFFYLDQSFRESVDLSDRHEEALDMVWDKLESLLESAGIKVIRQADVPFDAASHEAIEDTPFDEHVPAVARVVQPGYLYNGNVIKAARVVVGRTYNASHLLRGENL